MKKSNGNKNVAKCGICGEIWDERDMFEDTGSESGYLCFECYSLIHPEYDDEF